MNDVGTVMNKNNIICDSFGMYPSFVAGVLNSVEEIHFYVLCNEQLHYVDYI